MSQILSESILLNELSKPLLFPHENNPIESQRVAMQNKYQIDKLKKINFNDSNQEYKIIDKLFDFSFGKIYKIFNSKERKYFTLKVYDCQNNMNVTYDDCFQKFLEELAIIKKFITLKSNNLIFGMNFEPCFFEKSNRKIFCILYDHGHKTLESIIKSRKESNKKYSEPELTYILNKLVNVLKILKENNLLYSEIRPTNIYINYEENDYKISIYHFDRIYNLKKINEKSIYTAPELLNNKNNKEYDSSISDVYSLGILIIEMMGFNIKEFNYENFMEEIEINYNQLFSLLKFMLNSYEERINFDGILTFLESLDCIMPQEEIFLRNVSKIIDENEENIKNIDMYYEINEYISFNCCEKAFRLYYEKNGFFNAKYINNEEEIYSFINKYLNLSILTNKLDLSLELIKKKKEYNFIKNDLIYELYDAYINLKRLNFIEIKINSTKIFEILTKKIGNHSPLIYLFCSFILSISGKENCKKANLLLKFSHLKRKIFINKNEKGLFFLIFSICKFFNQEFEKSILYAEYAKHFENNYSLLMISISYLMIENYKKALENCLDLLNNLNSNDKIIDYELKCFSLVLLFMINLYLGKSEIKDYQDIYDQYTINEKKIEIYKSYFIIFSKFMTYSINYSLNRTIVNFLKFEFENFLKDISLLDEISNRFDMIFPKGD